MADPVVLNKVIGDDVNCGMFLAGDGADPFSKLSVVLLVDQTKLAFVSVTAADESMFTVSADTTSNPGGIVLTAQAASDVSPNGQIFNVVLNALVKGTYTPAAADFSLTNLAGEAVAGNVNLSPDSVVVGAKPWEATFHLSA